MLWSNLWAGCDRRLDMQIGTGLCSALSFIKFLANWCVALLLQRWIMDPRALVTTFALTKNLPCSTMRIGIRIRWSAGRSLAFRVSLWWGFASGFLRLSQIGLWLVLVKVLTFRTRVGTGIVKPTLTNLLYLVLVRIATTNAATDLTEEIVDDAIKIAQGIITDGPAT